MPVLRSHIPTKVCSSPARWLLSVRSSVVVRQERVVLDGAGHASLDARWAVSVSLPWRHLAGAAHPLLMELVAVARRGRRLLRRLPLLPWGGRISSAEKRPGIAVQPTVVVTSGVHATVWWLRRHVFKMMRISVVTCLSLFFFLYSVCLGYRWCVFVATKLCSIKPSLHACRYFPSHDLEVDSNLTRLFDLRPHEVMLSNRASKRNK